MEKAIKKGTHSQRTFFCSIVNLYDNFFKYCAGSTGVRVLQECHIRCLLGFYPAMQKGYMNWNSFSTHL